MKKSEIETKTFTATDGRKISMFDGKLHSWEGPAMIYPDKQKSEYWIYGFQYSKDDFKEQRRDRNGVPPGKNPQVKVRN